MYQIFSGENLHREKKQIMLQEKLNEKASTQSLIIFIYSRNYKFLYKPSCHFGGKTAESDIKQKR